MSQTITVTTKYKAKPKIALVNSTKQSSKKESNSKSEKELECYFDMTSLQNVLSDITSPLLCNTWDDFKEALNDVSPLSNWSELNDILSEIHIDISNKDKLEK